VGQRPGRKRKLSVSPGEQRRTLILIVCIACVPLLGTVAVVVSTTGSDLSDLAPLTPRAGEYLVLDWSALQHDRPHAMVAGTGFAVFNGAAAQALGYMTDGNRPIAKGEIVRDFVLLPDRGNLVHPAHRFGDQMIAIHLREGDAVSFSPMALVWVWGTLQASAGDPAGSKPLYALDQAHLRPADKAEIHKYFAVRQ